MPEPTPRRRALMERVASLRTRHYTFVLEDFHDPHNISAVLRTCECFGIQDVHVVEELRPFRLSPAILRGAGQWLDIHRWKSRAACLEYLHAHGYRIAVASSRGEKSFHESDLDPKTAIYLGTEFAGNSEHILRASDLVFRIRQHGFTESMNVSVCAGMMIAHLDRHMQVAGRERFVLPAEEREALVARWVAVHGLDPAKGVAMDAGGESPAA